MCLRAQWWLRQSPFWLPAAGMSSQIMALWEKQKAGTLCQTTEAHDWWLGPVPEDFTHGFRYECDPEPHRYACAVQQPNARQCVEPRSSRAVWDTAAFTACRHGLLTMHDGLAQVASLWVCYQTHYVGTVWIFTSVRQMHHSLYIHSIYIMKMNIVLLRCCLWGAYMYLWWSLTLELDFCVTEVHRLSILIDLSMD